MFNLEKLIRPNILNLKPYSSARDEFSGKLGVFLDANENPYGKLNRYPDPHQKELKQALSALHKIPTESIFVGNGSDEVIDLAFRIFCTPGKDKALILTPTYGMYEVSANINDVELIRIPFDANFKVDFSTLEPYLADPYLKLIFICSPNNPSGTNMDHIQILLESFDGIVFVDEAYIDFSGRGSWKNSIGKFPNLVVSQTFSKAWGLAAVRIGIAFANPATISYFSKTKPPYNVSKLNQDEAIKALKGYVKFEKKRRSIILQRRLLVKKLSKLSIITKIYPSDANFILVETPDANRVYTDLISRRIITRNRHTVVANCIRITVGTPTENKRLVEALKRLRLN